MKKNISFDNKSLSRLFDLQRFSQNDRLAKIINDVESRYGKAISDEDLAYVNAAGEAEPSLPSDKFSDNNEEEMI